MNVSALRTSAQRLRHAVASYLQLALICTFLLISASVPAYAQTATPMPTAVPTAVPSQAAPTIEFSLSPFFTALNTYLPIFMALFAVIGGISGAMALSRYIIGAIVRAFSGGNVD